MAIKLNPRSRAVYDFIVTHKRKNDGVPPSNREIMIATDISSTSVVDYYLNRLELAGLIRQLRGPHGNRVARGIVVVNGKWAPPSPQLSDDKPLL